MVAVERFGRGAAEIGIAASKRATRSLVGRGRSRQARRSRHAASPRRRRTKSSISALAGPVSKATISPAAPEIGDVADAAPVEEHQRPLQRRADRGVIERRQRRAFAARRDIGASGNRRRRRCRAAAAARAPSQSWRVNRACGRCSTVWPCRPTSATLARAMACSTRNASTAATCASVTVALQLVERPARRLRGRR